MKAVISKIKFFPLGPEDIRKMSVMEVTKTKIDEPGSVSDPRLGPAGYQKPDGAKRSYCPTCKLDELNCPGHFSYIALKYPLIHPLFAKYVLKLVKMFCFNCGRFMFQKLNGKYPSFENISPERTICPLCCFAQPTWAFVEETVRIKCSWAAARGRSEEAKELVMTPRELGILLANFDKEDLEKISFTKYPENLIISLLPVAPPCVRPPLYIDGQLHDDHLTVQYNEIVKINAALQDDSKAADVGDLRKLTYKIRALFLERKGGAAQIGTVTKPAIKRLSGKEGLMRDSIMGKRVDKSGRTVIGPEPTLLINQVAIPEEMAESLTVKELVCDHNIEKFEALIKRGEVVKFITRKEPGSAAPRSFHASYIPQDFRLQIGDQLDRKLTTGDMVIINRQPTLHCGSLIAFNAVVQSGRTIRFNLSNTKTFNADFDGDEMNVHIPQMYNARAELEELSSIKNHLCSQKNGRPNIVLVQDNVLALYLMTSEDMDVSREEFFDLMMLLVDERREPWSFERVDNTLAKMKETWPARPYCSRAVLSMCLPDSLFFSRDEDRVRIERGLVIEGLFDKKVMISVFDIVFHTYPSAVAEMMINNLQRVGNQWLRLRGFSVGLEDCIIKNSQVTETIENLVQKAFYEADIVEHNTHRPAIREIKVQEALNKAQSVGLKISKEGFGANNNIVQMIKSGSKGDYFNAAQISGLLGEQYIKGKRTEKILNNGMRSLCHFPFECETLEQRYASRGFIKGNFYGGLSPRDIYFHGEAGRSGVVDTAMGTSETGYMHRRIIKLTEDMKVTYDGTVRDETNAIYQFTYGNGFEITKAPNPKYIHNLVAALNSAYESSFK